jgi:hypothetical protein
MPFHTCTVCEWEIERKNSIVYAKLDFVHLSGIHFVKTHSVIAESSNSWDKYSPTLLLLTFNNEIHNLFWF